MIWKIRAALIALVWSAVPAQACDSVIFEEVPFTICEADATRDDIRLFLNDADGAPHSTFGSINSTLAPSGEALVFAMNGGMYHEDRRPVGHYVEAGEEQMRVIRRSVKFFDVPGAKASRRPRRG